MTKGYILILSLIGYFTVSHNTKIETEFRTDATSPTIIHNK